MIRPAASQTISGYGAGAGAALRVVAVAVEPARGAARAAPRPAARRVAGGLEALLCDDAPPRDPAPARAARAAFTAGDGYLTGQMIDRAI